MKIKSRFALKRGVLLDLKISNLGGKRDIFLAQNPRKGGIFQGWVQAWYTFWSEVGEPGLLTNNLFKIVNSQRKFEERM